MLGVVVGDEIIYGSSNAIQPRAVSSWMLPNSSDEIDTSQQTEVMAVMGVMEVRGVMNVMEVMKVM